MPDDAQFQPPLKFELRTLRNPANDNLPIVVRRKKQAQRYLGYTRLLEALSDRRPLSVQERENLRKCRQRHRYYALWIAVWYRSGGLCEMDGVRPMQELHHKHYRTYGMEQPEDMEGLCADCHRSFHRNPRRPANDNLNHLDDLLQERLRSG